MNRKQITEQNLQTHRVWVMGCWEGGDTCLPTWAPMLLFSCRSPGESSQMLPGEAALLQKAKNSRRQNLE